MILKGKASQEIEPLKQEELVEKLVNDIFANCRHTITFEQVNPDGPQTKTICKICGEEVVERLDQNEIDELLKRGTL